MFPLSLLFPHMMPGHAGFASGAPSVGGPAGFPAAPAAAPGTASPPYGFVDSPAYMGQGSTNNGGVLSQFFNGFGQGFNGATAPAFASGARSVGPGNAPSAPQASPFNTGAAPIGVRHPALPDDPSQMFSQMLTKFPNALNEDLLRHVFNLGGIGA
jgi:hypothetical protein